MIYGKENGIFVHNKLHAIKPIIGGQSLTYRSRKEQVILDRLRIGHTRLTHSFLLKGDPPPAGAPNRGGGLGGSQPPLNFGWGG